MKLAVTSHGPQLHSALDPRFGRARHFIVVDTETGASTAVDNSDGLDLAQGAGIQAGRRIVELGVEALVTGHVGPKALAILRAGRVRIYTGASGAVADALELFRQGRLACLDSADPPGAGATAGASFPAGTRRTQHS